MARIAKADMHNIIDAAARAIRQADRGGDGIVSRDDMQQHMEAIRYFDKMHADAFGASWNGGLAEMKAGIDDTRAALIETFFSTVDQMDYQPGARVTDADIDRAVAYAKDNLIDAYDTNNNGLSQSEVAQMESIGQMTADLVRQTQAYQKRFEFVATKVNDLETKQDAMALAVEQGDWDAVYSMFDKGVRDTQAGLGIGRDRFILEALGFGTVRDNITSLSQIKSIAFDEQNGPMPNGPDLSSVAVTATLADGTTAMGLVLLEDKADALFNFTSAVG